MAEVDGVVSQHLYAYLASKGEPSWRAKYLSIRLGKAFQSQAYAVFRVLENLGWTYEEIYFLDIKSRCWRKHPALIVRLQTALQDAQCSPELAKCIIMEPFVQEITDSSRVTQSFRALRELGFNDKEIRFVILRKPRLLALPKETLEKWIQESRSTGKDPTMFLHFLDPAIRQTMKEMPEEGAELDPNIFSAGPQDFPVHQDKVPHDPKPVRQPRQTIIELELKPVISNDTARSEIAPLRLKPIPALDISLALEDVPIIPKPPLVPVKLAPAPRPPALPVSDRVYSPEDRNEMDWPKFARQVLDAVVPDWNEKRWDDWNRENPWIREVGQRTKNLDQLSRWVKLYSNKPAPRDARSRLLASALLGRNLAQEKKLRSRKRIALVSSSILDIPEMALYLRLYTLRRVLDCEPMHRPDLLCLPYEQVISRRQSQPANFSIPPPSGTEPPRIEEMQAKLDELRYRANILRDKGLVPWRKPYVNMIIEPAQEKFLRRLEKFLERKRRLSA